MSEHIGTSELVTVRLPRDMVVALEGLRKSGQIDLSAYVPDAETMKRRIEAAHANCDAWLREAGYPIPGPEEEAWARACYRLSAAGHHDLVQLLFDRAGEENFRLDDLDLPLTAGAETKVA